MALVEPIQSRFLTPQNSAADVGSLGRDSYRKMGSGLSNFIHPGRPDIWMRGTSSMKDSAPLLSKVLETHAWKEGRVACGVASMRGFRVQMEDCACILRPLNEASQNKYRFCGVFDGHAQSRKVAETLEENLPRKIGEQKQKAWMTRSGLEKACLDVDKDILRSEYSDAGSTAIFCVIKSDPVDNLTLSLGCVGDSQAVIVHSDFATPPTVPLGNNVHRPQLLSSELDRIHRAGGYVVNNRVDGELAVSRAFGDAKYKRNISLKANEQKVVAVPAVAENIILAAGDVLVLGCDGLYDSMSANQIDTFVRSTLISVMVKHKRFLENQHEAAAAATRQAHNHNPPSSTSLWNLGECLSEVAGLLVDEALLRGSRDNITVMLIQLSKKYETDSLPWSDKFSRYYVPPIIFLPQNSNAGFLMTVRDELRTFCLDEDLTLSQAEKVDDLPAGGFLPSLSRSQMVAILQSTLNRQWEHRDTWVRLGDFEIPDKNFSLVRKKYYQNNIPPKRTLTTWQKFLQSFICFAGNSVEIEEERKHHQQHRLSSSIGAGAFSKVSSVHVSSVNGTAFVVSSINSVPVTSRQTSAAEDELPGDITEEMQIHSSVH